MHPFAKEIEILLKEYEQNKGGFRNGFEKVFGKSSFFAHSYFIDDLIVFYNRIKDKQALSTNDLKWFYNTCIKESGEYNTQSFNDTTNQKLSSKIFRSLKSKYKELFTNVNSTEKKLFPTNTETSPTSYVTLNKYMTDETFDTHGNFTGTEVVRPRPEIRETFDIHGNFTGTEVVRPPVETIETFDRHGNFTGTEVVKPYEERIETYDTHGNFTGTEAVKPYEERIETYDTHGNFTGTISATQENSSFFGFF